MSGRCDLHIHSNYSDSDASIEQIFKTAKARGIKVISITDHDTVDGIIPARELSKKYGIELVEGIELSADYDGVEVHVLSYFFDPHNEKLNNALKLIKQLRWERLLAMMDKLIALGITVDKKEVISKIKDNIPTRLHLALHLVEINAAKNLWDAFKKYLSPGKPGYVGRFKYTVKEIIELVKDAGGLTFLAHPHYLAKKSWIDEFASYGLDGLEVVYPRLSEATISIYERIANRLGLLKSGGSDAHGSYKDFTGVGRVSIPYEWVNAMKNRVLSRSSIKQAVNHE